MTPTGRIRSAVPFLLYPILALLAFPVTGAILAGQAGPAFGLDVFDDGGGVPRLAIVAHDWAANGLTLWDPHLAGGNAFLGQFAISPVAVDAALALVIGPFAAWAVTSWLMVTTAGVAMHLFLRGSMRLPLVAAVGGSILYLFGAWHYIYGFSVLLLPAFLWLGDRAIRATGDGRQVVAGALLGAFALYEGLSQCVIIVALVQLAWLLVIESDRTRLDRTARWLASWLGAFALFGPALLTQLLMLPDSQRTIWDLAALFGADLPTAVSTVVRHYASVLAGVPLAAGFGPSDFRYGTLFLGGLGLPLLVLGLVAGRRDRRALFVVALLVAIPVLDLLAILVTPLQQEVGGFLKSFQLVRIRHFYPFAVCSVAALGIDVLVGGDRSWLRSRWRVGLVALSLVPIGVALAVAVRHVVIAVRTGVGDPARESGWLLIVTALVVGLVAVLVVGLALVRGRRVPGARIGAIVLLVAVLLVAERAFYASGSALLDPSVSSYAATLAETDGQRFLAAQPRIAGERVLSFGQDANRMTTPGLRQADGYQAIYPLAYHDLFRRLIAPGLAMDPAMAVYFDTWGARAYAFGPAVDPELIALLGIRWLYVDGPEVPTVPGIVPRWQDGGVTVYEVPQALPRAFLAGAIETAPSASAALDAMSAASLDDLRGRAFATSSPRLTSLLADAPGPLATPGPAGTATITRDTPDRVEVAVRADRPGLLVLTDVFAPGWVAERDGVVVPIAQVDGAFRGVAVGPDTRTVVFRYAPGFATLGLGLAVLAVLVMAAWAIRSTVRSRRRRPVAPSSTTLQVDAGDGPGQAEER